MAQVTLTEFGGLVASLRPSELPDGASPRCLDMDFVVGRTMQRPGEQNVYSYSGISQGPNPAFTAVDTSLGSSVWANPNGILVNDANYTTNSPGDGVASVSMISGGSYTSSLHAPLVAPTVVFSGPGSGAAGTANMAFDSVSGKWYVGSVTMTAIGSYTGFVGVIFSGGTVVNPATGTANLVATGSDYLDVTNFTFSVPGTQQITGVEISIKGHSSVLNNPSLGVVLVHGGTSIGDPISAFFQTTDTTQVLGGPSFTWGSLTPAIVNSVTFGVRLQAFGTNTIFLDYITVKLYLTSASPNFNFIHTFRTGSGVEYNLGLDALGNWWIENVSSLPGQFSLILSGTTPNSWASGETVYNRAFVTNMNLLGQVTGSDIPRQYNFDGQWWDRVTQVGPAAPPVFSAAQSSGAVANITSVTLTGTTALITAINAYVPGEVGTFAGLTGGASVLNGMTLIVLSTGLSGTGFQVAFSGGAGGPFAQASATFTPQYTYPISTITQPPAMSDPSDAGHFQALLWSAGPGSPNAGSVITVYYSDSFAHPQPDTILVNAFNSGLPVFVYISNAPFGNGVWQVTSVGNAIPPGGTYYRWYFTYQVPTSNYQFFGGPDAATGFYQITQGTVTTATPVPALAPGAQVSVAGTLVVAWDGVYTVVAALSSGAFNISQTALSGGTATYTWTLVSGTAPVAGQLVTITNTLNGNGILNVTDALIATATGTTSGTFTVVNFPGSVTFPTVVEQGQATTAGNQFIIDPGAAAVGSTTVNPIYGNSTGGTLTIVGNPGGGTLPIGAGTRQGVVMFITRNGLVTAPSPPMTFDVPTDSNYIQAAQVPLGPPNTVSRLVAFTEAGQNGVPGANFYTTQVPTIFTVNGVQYISSSFLIPDNLTTQAKFTFSDQVLLNSEAIDIVGNNLFNLIEIGNPAVVFQYAERTFYVGCQNKVQNFNNLSFDGGYLQPTGGTTAIPLGWSVDPNSSFPFGTTFTITGFQISSNIVTFTASNTLTAGLNVIVNGLSTGTYLNGKLFSILTASSTQFTVAFTHANVGPTVDSGSVKSVPNTISLRISPVSGNSLYVVNNTASSQLFVGVITQSAYQDAWFTPILNPSGFPVPYSVRITARIPSGNINGELNIDLTDGISQSIYGNTYGKLTIPFSSMTNQMQTFTGVLLGGNGLNAIPPDLLLRMYGSNMGPGADYEIDRIEVFPTNQPVLTNTVLVSYPQQPEQVDGETGQLTLSSQNQNPVYGATVIHNQLVFKKSTSVIECEDAPNYEPSKWSTREVSQAGSGTVGPNAFSQGTDWDLSLHKTGIYVYQGGSPMPISRELQGFASGSQFWDTINWKVAHTFWLCNDLRARRFYVGVAMNTPNQWMPNAPHAVPTQPNVILMCNYEGCPQPQELEMGSPVHVTMFGTVKAIDMRRKWSVWQIASPYSGIVTDGIYGIETIYVCNGNGTGKIYRLLSSSIQMTDDGVPINPDYVTAALPGAEKAQALGIGMGQKYAYKWMANVQGQAKANQLEITHYQNTLDSTYPAVVPFVPALTATMQNNIEWRAEVRGQRIFTEFSMEGPGYFELGELMADFTPHPWGAFRGVSK